ncbi:MAG: hypothetical protein EXR95_07280 [Gemmatimonadetes bacterium]|nr:hypothetical protein [Gemmatimonadota bacterium]
MLAQVMGPPTFELAITDSTLSVSPRPVDPDSAGADSPRAWPRPDGYRLRLDGKEARLPGVGPSTTVEARWDGSAIAVERKVEDGPEVTERWSVDARGRLIIDRKIDLPRGPKLELHQVFRRVGAEK